MNVINHRKFQKTSGGPSKGLRRVYTIAGLLIGLFIIANIGMALLYANKVLPNQTLAGQDISGASYADVERLIKAYTLPNNLILRKDTRTESVPTDQLNIRINQDKTMNEVRAKPLLPLFALFEKQRLPLILEADTTAIADKILILDASFSHAATDRRVTFNGSAFTVEDAKGGYTFDADKTARLIVSSLAQGKRAITVATESTPPGSNSGDFSKERDQLNKQLTAHITYKAGAKTAQTTKKDIGEFFEHEGRTMVLSDAAITAYLTKVAASLGVTPSNSSDAVIATRYAVQKAQDIAFVLSNTDARTLTYCTVADGVSQSGLGDLVGKLATAYGDPRGWNNGGRIAFQHVASGCDYRVVLAAPSAMTRYGEICDDYYNCQVGSNVIVNNNRWLYATEPWNKTGQTLETYRLLIINHETGHRLGLRDYNVCSGAGNPAPVMMQQSIDLMGCSFNVWPLQSELDKL
jgi:hypothetical protein